jgi:hypothetical protein
MGFDRPELMLSDQIYAAPTPHQTMIGFYQWRRALKSRRISLAHLGRFSVE